MVLSAARVYVGALTGGVPVYVTVTKAQFPRKDTLKKDLHAAVDAYFEKTGKDPFGGTRMVLKSVVILAWLAGSYAAMLLLPLTWWQGVLLAVNMGLAMAAWVFNVGHDANHGSYSRHKWVNSLLAYSFDMIGASGFLWRFRHNIVHHTYTNIAGVDHDISTSAPFFRTTQRDPYYPVHRYQHLYAWVLYMFITPNWAASDFQGLYLSRAYGGMAIPRARTRDLVAFWGAKVLLLVYFVGLPLLAGAHPLMTVGAVVITFAVMGMMLSTVFQLAHVVEPSGVFYPTTDQYTAEDEWAVHQLKTCTDFAPTNPLANWYLGGLNFQAIHHLFPRICHLHYPALAPIVAEVARKHGVPYLSFNTVGEALGSHYRVLKSLSVAPAAEQTTPSTQQVTVTA